MAQTRREQVRAYRFINRRMVSALIAGDPESNDLPMRRLGLSIFGSVMLAAIVLAIVGVYGLYNPGGGALTDNALVIERETGARFVYLNQRLYPVLNFTSARLILGQPDPLTQTMSQNSLRDIPRGKTLGIPNAPDSVPSAKALLGLPWSICGAPSLTGRITNLSVGRTLTGSTAVGEEALLVESNSVQYLIWHNHRMRVFNPGGVLAALELSFARPVTVGPSLINAITAGPDLRPPAVENSGKDSGRTLGGRAAKVGEVFRAGNESYVLLGDGLAPINPVTARLLLANASTPPHDISPNEAGSQRSQTRVEAPGSLNVLPKLHELDPNRAAICATYRGTAGDAGELGTTVEFFEQSPAALAPADANSSGLTSRAIRTVDRVLVDGGHGALVQTLPVPGANAAGTTVYLITDEGVKYPLGVSDTAGPARVALGFADVDPVLVPASLLTLVPTGPTLDADAALTYGGVTPAPTVPGPTSTGATPGASTTSRPPGASSTSRSP